MSTANGHLSVGTAREQSPLLGPGCEPETNPTILKRGLIGPRATRLEKPMPQTIGHRGFSAAAPENTMAAFKAATEAGAEALETDLHLTRDGVVVLCHDQTLQRCYGNKAKVRDLDWSEISKLRTLREPRQPMPRLIDLLEYLEQPGLENIGLMLDIKVILQPRSLPAPDVSRPKLLIGFFFFFFFFQTHNDAEEIVKRTAEALSSVSSRRPWNTRVTPCCWNATYIKLSMIYLPDYPITHVGFSISYARCLIDIPNISFSIRQHALASSSGERFLQDMKQLGIPTYVWTVNEESRMEWSVRKGLSGVITDEVALFREVCNRMRCVDAQTSVISKPQKKASLSYWSLYRSVRFRGEMVVFNFLATMFIIREWLKHGSISHHINKVLNG
ncbi:PLC-like phosphodiesterase [Xylaria sp. FL1042]|nr:PLC-like phosphodiesterase [Xylaria sp. FL1042]